MIKYLTNQEKWKTHALYRQAFPEDSEAFMEAYYQNRMGENQILAIEESDGIVSMLHLNPYRLELFGNMFDASYIVAVATKPEFRRKGFMGRLVTTAFRDCYLAKNPFTYLMPARESLYRPFGFETVAGQENWAWDQEGQLEVPGVEFRNVSENQLAELSEFVNHKQSTLNQLFVRRDVDYYKKLIKELHADQSALKVGFENGRITDVFCRSSWQNNMFEIWDLWGEHREWFETRLKQRPSKPIMLRLLNLESFLPLFGAESEFTITIEIQDAIIPWNNGVFNWTFTGKTSILKRVKQKIGVEAQIPIDALTRWLFRVQTIDELVEQSCIIATPSIREQMKRIRTVRSISIRELN